MKYTTAIHLALLVGLLESCSIPTPSTENTNGVAPVSTSSQLSFEHGVRSIFEDSKGNFWFGSYQGGVCLFDGKNFTYFTEKDGLGNNQVRGIQEDQNGNIWFETGKKLSRYDGERITSNFRKDYGSKNEWQKKETDLWFKGDEVVGVNEIEGQPGTYRYDGDKLTFLVFPIPDFSWEWTPEAHDGGNYYSVTTGAVKGKNGMLWFGTYGAVIGYDGKSFTIINNESLGLNEETGFLHVRSIFVDSKGNLWIGNNGIGVLFYDGDTTINFTDIHNLGKKDTNGMSPSLDRVFSIGEDSAGNIWFGTVAYGAWRYDGESLTNYGEKDGLASQFVWTFYEDRRGDFWVGGAEPISVSKFNGTSFERIY